MPARRLESGGLRASLPRAADVLARAQLCSDPLRKFGVGPSHATAFMRFFASMARTNLSHFAMAARFSGI